MSGWALRLIAGCRPLRAEERDARRGTVMNLSTEEADMELFKEYEGMPLRDTCSGRGISCQ